MSKFYKTLLSAGLTTVILLISSCGGENDDDTKRLEGVQESQTEIPAVENTDNDTSAVSDTPTGSLMILSQEILYQWDVDDDMPEVIAADVSEDNMVLAPSSNHLFYVVREDGSAVLYGIDTATGETQRIFELGRLRFRTELQWQLGNFSPDEKWALLTSFDFNLDPTVISTDGSAEPIVVSEDFVNTFWLEDGRLLAYQQDFSAFRGGNNNPEAFPPVVSMTILDPATDERVDVEWIDELADVETFEMFQLVLIEHDLMLAPFAFDQASLQSTNFRIDHEEGVFFTGNGQFCFDESISQTDGDQWEVVYQRDDVFAFLNMYELADESVIFMQVSYPNCTIGPPVGELIHLETGQDPEILTNQITSQLDLNSFNDRFFDINQRVAISPDRGHVAWIETNVQGTESELVFWNVATNNISPVSFDIAEFRPRRVFWFE